MVKWLRICLPIQGTQFPSWAQEDPTFHRVTKPMYLESVLRNERRHCSKKSEHHREGQSRLLQLEKASGKKQRPSEAKNEDKTKTNRKQTNKIKLERLLWESRG